MMTCLTGTLAPSKSWKNQEWTFLALPSMERPTLTITQSRSDRPTAKKYTEVYEVDEDLNVPVGTRVLLLSKQSEVQEYEVTLAPGYCRCNCDGFSGHKHCKHVEASIALLSKLA